MDLFLKDRIYTKSDDPEIPLDTVVRASGVDKRVVRKFVKDDYLFFDPEKHTIKTRNKLFLNVYDMDQNERARIHYLKQKQERLVARLDNPDASYSEQEDARTQLTDISKKLRDLKA